MQADECYFCEHSYFCVMKLNQEEEPNVLSVSIFKIFAPRTQLSREVRPINCKTN
jgi:hypothetical protein